MAQYLNGQVSGINSLPTTSQGGRKFLGFTNIRVVTSAADTATSDDGIVHMSTGNTIRVATLPAANTYVGLLTYMKIDTGTGAVTITAAGTDTIEGATTFALIGQYSKIMLISDGSGIWYIVDTKTGSTSLPRIVIATDTATVTDSYLLAATAGGAFTETLPLAAQYRGGIRITKTDSSANQLTIGISGSDTINGASTYTTGYTTQYTSKTFMSDGVSKWYVF